jgi:hypothetical protein
MNELEAALKQLRPEPVVSGAILFEAGRAAAARSLRFWRIVSLVPTVIAVVLGVVLLSPPVPVRERQIVYVPVASPVPTSVEPSVAAAPDDDPLPGWRFRQHHVARILEPISDAGEEPADMQSPQPVGNLIRDPSLWSAATNSGERR